MRKNVDDHNWLLEIDAIKDRVGGGKEGTHLRKGDKADVDDRKQQKKDGKREELPGDKRG